MVSLTFLCFMGEADGLTVKRRLSSTGMKVLLHSPGTLKKSIN